MSDTTNQGDGTTHALGALEEHLLLSVSLFLRPSVEAADGFGAASNADIALVLAFAEEAGLTVTGVDRDARLVEMGSSVVALSEAFAVRLLQFRRREITYFHNDRAPSLPDELVGVVLGVFGLENFPHFRPHLRFVEDAEAGDDTAWPAGFTPVQVASFYGFPSGLDGAGQKIGIVELGGGYDAASMKQYFVNDLKLAMPQIKPVWVGVKASAPSSPPSSADLEVSLDVQVIGAVANKAAISVYFAACSLQGFLSAVGKAIGDGNNIVSISWGALESGLPAQFLNALNQTLQQASTKGVTVCVSSGDNGSCGVKPEESIAGPFGAEFPATSPFVLACGGTRIEVESGTITNEVVWNESANGKDGAGGGGVSQYFPVPSYQAAVPRLPALAPDMSGGWSASGGFGRMVPDVAGNAARCSGYIIRAGGKLGTIGGTSAVAPLWAALVALLNQGTKRNLGFINPQIYAAGAQVCRNVESGSNAMSGSGCTSYEAQPGYDVCTGWGSPLGGQALALFGR
jgi:kumamolisin